MMYTIGLTYFYICRIIWASFNIIFTYIHMWPALRKPAILSYKLKFISLPGLYVHSTTYVYSLTQRAGLFFHSNFYRPCIFMTGEMVPIEDSKLVVETWYCCHCHYSYICILKSCRGYWPIVTMATYNYTATYRLHNHSKLNHLYCFTLFFHFATTHFTMHCPSHPPPYECCPKIDDKNQNPPKSVVIWFARLVV